MDPHSSGPEIGRKRHFYADRLAAAGFTEAGRDIPIARLVALAENSSEAAAVARSGAEWILNSYLGDQHRPVMQGSFTPAGVDPLQRYLDEVILHGTSDKVSDEILSLRDEIGLDYLLCAPLSHQSFMLLTEKVLPRIA
jgi:alkanesulfonate monooxygenase SsuD/methylene tetrahydromethanopterin reductase-like flavin-dependent oxidoreductase (luciferase family)